MQPKITEDSVEQFVIELLESQGYQYLHGPTVAPDGELPERERFSDVLLKDRLKKAIKILILRYQRMRETVLCVMCST